MAGSSCWQFTGAETDTRLVRSVGPRLQQWQHVLTADNSQQYAEAMCFPDRPAALSQHTHCRRPAPGEVAAVLGRCARQEMCRPPPDRRRRLHQLPTSMGRRVEVAGWPSTPPLALRRACRRAAGAACQLC